MKLVCECVRDRARLCSRAPSSLPVVWQQSSVSIILVTLVPSKNSVTVSGQPVLGDVSIRLGGLVPVQLHGRCVHHHMSGLRPNSWCTSERKRWVFSARQARFHFTHLFMNRLNLCFCNLGLIVSAGSHDWASTEVSWRRRRGLLSSRL